MKTKDVALTIVISALYAGLVLVFAPISFWITQVRVADSLIPLSVALGWPAVLGVTIGCAAANIITPLPSVFIDITLGSAANFIASYGAYKLASASSQSKRKFLACLFSAVVVTVIVGTYIAWLLELPLWLGWVSLFFGSFISMCVLGYAILTALGRIAE